MDPLAPAALAATLSLFACGGVTLAIGQHFGTASGAAAWRRFAWQGLLVALVLVPPAFGATPWHVAIVALAAIGGAEVCAASFGGRRAAIAGAAASSGLVGASLLVPALPWWGALGLLVPPLALAAVLAGKGPPSAGALAAWALAFPIVPLACAARLPELGSALGDAAFCYGVVEFGDSCAYLVGKHFGKAPLFAAVSPNKTRLGAIGGLAGATGAGLLVAFTQPGLGLGACAGLAAALGALAICADVATSAVKRRLGIKDFASWLPGHGSLLDAYDTTILVLPAFYWMARWLRGSLVHT